VYAGKDPGYIELFTTHNASMDVGCIEFASPEWLTGTFVLPSLGQFEMKEERFTGLLDGFGKLASFSLSNNSLCYQSQMMDTGFYNDSLKAGKIAPSLMFAETIPKRNYSGIQNLAGPNDNVFVNTYSLGLPGNRSNFRCVTDSQMQLEFDPLTLKTVGTRIKWNDKMAGLDIGSAHPLSHPNEPGCIVNVHPETAYTMFSHDVSVFKICNDAPYSRVMLNTVKTPYMPYYHSWGLTKTTVILPMMHFTLNFIDMIAGKTLSESFQNIKGTDTTIHLMPLDGSTSPTTVVLKGIELYYTHVMNAYDDTNIANGNQLIIFDCIKFSHNPFSGNGASLSMYRNKKARDRMGTGETGIPTRITIDTVQNTATAMPMKGFDFKNNNDVMGKMETDFPKINPNFSAKKYCLFWAVQWRTNYPKDISYAQMGLIKYNVCTGEYSFWRYENVYPSEPTFVPNTNANAAEDDGVLVFSALNGETKTTNFFSVNATTMKTISNATIPDTIGFTTHGQFYQNMII
jgi:carotenoid cleavage dioxygenase-like enzyme